jgi:hypothetical protein
MKKKNMNWKIAILMLSILIIAIIPGIEASLITKEIKTDNISIAEPRIIYLGKMGIVEDECIINLEHDNLLTIDGGTQNDTFHFVIDYVFEECNIDQEKWCFKINMSGVANTSTKIVHEVIFDDNWWLNDEADGEIWIEVSGYDIWLLNENFITVECKKYSDILWLTDFALVDQSLEKMVVKTKNFPAPEISWSVPDGEVFQVNRVNNKVTKDVILTNEGGWTTVDLNIDFSGSSDFKIVDGQKDKITLAPRQTHTLTVEFNPTSRVSKTASFLAFNNAEWYCEDSELTINGQVGRARFKSNILSNILVKFPLLQQLLLNL